MQFRATAFLKRSVLQDSRIFSHHGMRAALAAMILYLFSMEFLTSTVRAGAGQSFASTVVMCCYWFLTLVGGMHFSTAIVEEKEEDTLPLLRMTGASSFAILAGKSLPRLALAVLFLFVVSPFLMLSVTLGGVLPMGLISSILSILCYAIMLCQVGLFASVISRNTRRAFTWTCVFWLLIELGHWWTGLASGIDRMLLGYSASTSKWQDLMQQASFWLSQRSLVSNLSLTLLSFEATDIWHPWMTWHLIFAAVFFCLSWLSFERFTAGSMSGSESSTPRTFLKSRKGSTSRAGHDAVMWKSWQFVSGGFRWFIGRSVGATSVIVLISWGVTFMSQSRFQSAEMIGWGLFLGIVFFVINFARLVGGLLSSEIHEKTLVSLVMLPRTTSSIYGSMLLGLVPGIVAGACTAGVMFLLLLAESGSNADQIANFIVQPWMWHFITWILATASLGLLLTTYVRHGGMLIAVAVGWIVMPMFCGLTLGVMSVGGGSGMAEFFQYIVPLFLIAAELLLCVALFYATVRRLEALASGS